MTGSPVMDSAVAPAAHDAIAADLYEQGWSVHPGLAGQRLTRVLAARARRWHTAGAFHRAGVGRGRGHAIRPDIRGDRVLWLDRVPDLPSVRLFQARLEGLRVAVNRRLFLGLEDYEGHFALYPPGSAYRRHYDRFADGGRRTLTAILYLNEGWEPADGGQLRLYPEDGPVVDVEPEAGTLATFISAEMAHEVLATRRERLAVTGWFRRRPLGAGIPGSISPG
ncbi:MAG: 2OG-Fe(II) oxygenase [Thiohalospira sp.]